VPSKVEVGKVRFEKAVCGALHNIAVSDTG